MTDATEWTDTAGRWVRQEDGLDVLIEPSPEWIAAQETPAATDTPIDAAALAAAEAARRAAYDAVLLAGPLSTVRLRAADQAGSEAFLNALNQPT